MKRTCIAIGLLALLPLFADMGQETIVSVDLSRRPLNGLSWSWTESCDSSVRLVANRNGDEFCTTNWTCYLVVGGGSSGCVYEGVQSGYNETVFNVDASSLPTNGRYTVQIVGTQGRRSEEWARGYVRVNLSPAVEYMPTCWMGWQKVARLAALYVTWDDLMTSDANREELSNTVIAVYGELAGTGHGSASDTSVTNCVNDAIAQFSQTNSVLTKGPYVQKTSTSAGGQNLYGGFRIYGWLNATGTVAAVHIGPSLLEMRSPSAWMDYDSFNLGWGTGGWTFDAEGFHRHLHGGVFEPFTNGPAIKLPEDAWETGGTLALRSDITDADLTPATNYTDRALSFFADTGTVARAASYGTPTRWTDATGCVWEVVSDWLVYTNGVAATEWLAYDYNVDSGPGGYYVQLRVRPTEETVDSGYPVVGAVFPDGTPPAWGDEYEATYTSDAEYYGLANGDTIHILRGATNLVGYVALTKDIPDVSGLVTPAKIASVLNTHSFPAVAMTDSVTTGTNYVFRMEGGSLKLYMIYETNTVSQAESPQGGEQSGGNEEEEEEEP